MKKLVALFIFTISTIAFAKIPEGGYSFEKWHGNKKIVSQKTQIDQLGQYYGDILLENGYLEFSESEKKFYAETSISFKHVNEQEGRKVLFNFKYIGSVTNNSKSRVIFQIEDYRAVDFAYGSDENFTFAYDNILAPLFIGADLSFFFTQFKRIALNQANLVGMQGKFTSGKLIQAKTPSKVYFRK